MEQQALSISQVLEKVLEGGKLRALLCVAGGWAGGNAASKSKSFSKRLGETKQGCLLRERIQ